MTEKEKNKHGDARRYSLPFTFLALGVVLMSAFFLPVMYPLKAYAWVEFFTRLSVLLGICLGVCLFLIMVIGFFTTQGSKERIVIGLGIVAFAGCVQSETFLLLAWFSYFIVPVTLVVIAIWAMVILYRARPIYLPELLSLLGVATFFAGTFVIGQWFWFIREELHESAYINDRSYHLISHTGPLDPTIIRLYECDSLGLFCEKIYVPNGDYYLPDDQFRWEIVAGDETTQITIFVNETIVHEHQIE